MSDRSVLPHSWPTSPRSLFAGTCSPHTTHQSWHAHTIVYCRCQMSKHTSVTYDAIFTSTWHKLSSRTYNYSSNAGTSLRNHLQMLSWLWLGLPRRHYSSTNSPRLQAWKLTDFVLVDEMIIIITRNTLDCVQSNYSSRIVFSHIPIELGQTENSAIRSADPENPTVEPNMKWNGWPL